jgi:hypothetical protein
MTTYAKRKLKYSRNENFNLLHYVEWDRIVTLIGAQADWGLRYRIQGRIQRGAHPARAPPKIGKNMIFWRKIVIFHTKYPKYFRASLRSAQII